MTTDLVPWIPFVDSNTFVLDIFHQKPPQLALIVGLEHPIESETNKEAINLNKQEPLAHLHLLRAQINVWFRLRSESSSGSLDQELEGFAGCTGEIPLSKRLNAQVASPGLLPPAPLPK